LGKLREDELKQLISEARSSRSQKKQEDKNELMEIHSDYLEKLVAAPQLSKSKQLLDCITSIV
jgi:hypothetical protein